MARRNKIKTTEVGEKNTRMAPEAGVADPQPPHHTVSRMEPGSGPGGPQGQEDGALEL